MIVVALPGPQTRVIFHDRVPFEELPPGAAQKLSSLEINEDYWTLGRNLSALLAVRNFINQKKRNSTGGDGS